MKMVESAQKSSRKCIKMSVNAPQTEEIRDRILEAALPHIPFDGWQWAVAERAAQDCGYEKSMAAAIFPAGLSDLVAHFSDRADRWMLSDLSAIVPESLRVRDRVAMAVMTRIDRLTPQREAVRLAMAYWAVPTRHLQAGRCLWRTADRIWNWAGDTATDYNRYTKRTLLGGVIASTTLAWLNDGDPATARPRTEEFLHRRIENVMKLGKIVSKIRPAA